MKKDKKYLDKETRDIMNSKLEDKIDKWEWLNLWNLRWESYDDSMSDEEQAKIIDETIKELKKSEDSLANIISEYPDVKKAYLDNEKRDDPFYVDYNLLFNNVDMLMALSYSDDVKAIFTGTNSSDLWNADIISKTAEYDYREEMDMDLLSYELWIDKFLWWVWCVIREWNERTQSPSPKCWPVEYFRPDPKWWGHVDKYRYLWWYWGMTKQQMINAGDFFNIDLVVDTDRAEKEFAENDNWSNISQTADWSEDESAYFAIYNHFRTRSDWRKCLVTLANGWKTLIRYIELEYQIGWERVFPISLDFWRMKRDYPMWIRLYDLSWRKQKVLSLLLNLAVKKAVRSSLGNHIIADDAAVKNTKQLRQLTEFPEVILVDTNNWQKNVNNVISELQRSQVPQDNYNTEERIKQLSYEETSIWPNQLWLSPTWDQTATEIKDNAANSSIRLSLSNRISMSFRKDFFRKWLMMYNYHFPEWSKKQVIISREFWDRYLTFEKKYLSLSSDPHIKVVSKFDIEQKNKKLFANHVVLHSYIEKLAAQPYIPLEVRLSMRKALRLMGYEEDEILDYVKESWEEQEAKDQLRLLNDNVKLEEITPEQIDEHHEDYIHVYKQAKPTAATKSAISDRIRMMKRRDLERAKAIEAAWQQPNTNWMQNQMTANMLSQNNQQKQPSLADVQM